LEGAKLKLHSLHRLVGSSYNPILTAL